MFLRLPKLVFDPRREQSPALCCIFILTLGRRFAPVGLPRAGWQCWKLQPMWFLPTWEDSQGKQIVLFMLKMPGTLQAVFQLLTFETWASNWAKGGSSSLGCSPFPSPWNCTHFLPFQTKATCLQHMVCPCRSLRLLAVLVRLQRSCTGLALLLRLSSVAAGSWCCGDWGTGRETLDRFTCHHLRQTCSAGKLPCTGWNPLQRMLTLNWCHH